MFWMLISLVRFSAAHLVYVPESSLVVLTEDARVWTERVDLHADTIRYRRDRDILVARGHAVLILEGTDTLRGDSLRYDLKRRQGVAYGGSTYLEKGWLRGGKLYKLSEKTFLVRNGTFTTCDLDTPHYAFRSRYMKVLQGNMAIVKPLVLTIEDLPVAALPFWFFPVAEGRTSGFLTPSFGLSGTDGRYIRHLAYYWAASPYWDVTFSLNLFEKQKIKADVDVAYLWWKRMGGAFTLSGAEEFQTGTMRYSLQGNHWMNFSPRSRLTAQFNLSSDATYLRDYSETKEEFLQTNLQSFATYSYTTDKLGFSMGLVRTEDLARHVVDQTVPSVSLTYPSYVLGPLRFSTSSRALRVTHQDPDTAYDRRGVVEQYGVSASFPLFRYWTFTPSLAGKVFAVDRPSSGRMEGPFVTLGASAALSTTLYGYSTFGLGPFLRFRHVVQPHLSLAYTARSPEQPEAPFGEFSASTTDALVLNWSVQNTWEARERGKGAQKGPIRQLLTLQFSQQYNPRASRGSRWSDLSLTGEALRGYPLTVRFASAYEPGSWNRRYLRLDAYVQKGFSYAYPWLSPEEDSMSSLQPDTAKTDDSTQTPSAPQGSWRISLAYSLNQAPPLPAYQNLQISLGGQLTPHWRVHFSTGYDLTRGQWLSRSLQLTRDLHCWEAVLTWTQQGDFWYYDFRIWITKLPDVKVTRGLFEMFLPSF